MPISCHVPTTAAASRTSWHILLLSHPHTYISVPFAGGHLHLHVRREWPKTAGSVLLRLHSHTLFRDAVGKWASLGRFLLEKESCLDAWARPSYATRSCTRWHINVRIGISCRTCPCPPVYSTAEKPSKLSHHFRCHRCHCRICLMNCQTDIHWRLTCNKRNETKWNEMVEMARGLNKYDGRSSSEISFFNPFYACPRFLLPPWFYLL